MRNPEPSRTNPRPALRDLLILRAEGNPFCGEDLLRMPIADVLVGAQARPWRARAQRLDDPRGPETRGGVLQARLDALPAREVAALQPRAVVVWREHSAFAQADEFAFRQQLLHDVAWARHRAPGGGWPADRVCETCWR